jgi:hypothetical protein
LGAGKLHADAAAKGVEAQKIVALSEKMFPRGCRWTKNGASVDSYISAGRAH